MRTYNNIKKERVNKQFILTEDSRDKINLTKHKK